MARKSPFDVRSVDPAIVEIILGELVKAGGKIALSSIDDALRSERFAGRIESRMSRKTSTASDELVELAWFGLIDVKDGFILSKVNMEDLRRYLENDLRGNLERSYYSMEVLYRLMIDSLIRNGGRMPEHSLLEEISDSLVDPRQYPGYGFQVEGPVQIRFNQAKMFFLVRVGRKLGRIQREGSDILLVEKDADLRVKADFRNEKLGLKVREAQLKKIPYMLIVGDRECEKEGVTPRQRSGQNLPFMTGEEFIDLISEDCRKRR